ncbi:TM2 domain-containing protein [Aquirufa salirivi]|uniref:TM2 domain-containing protein n=1 Tax=Aquirufa salirivi TaxID=3104729 RepID=A0ABW8RU89_9BACT
MNPRFLPLISQLEIEEMIAVKQKLNGLSDSQQEQFLGIYLARRRDTLLILLCTLMGFVGFAGIHRFVTNRIGLGLLYFFTGGLLLIGTIVDLIKYKKIALKYNMNVLEETSSLIGNWQG